MIVLLALKDIFYYLFLRTFRDFSWNMHLCSPIWCMIHSSGFECAPGYFCTGRSNKNSLIIHRLGYFTCYYMIIYHCTCCEPKKVWFQLISYLLFLSTSFKTYLFAERQHRESTWERYTYYCKRTIETWHTHWIWSRKLYIGSDLKYNDVFAISVLTCFVSLVLLEF